MAVAPVMGRGRVGAPGRDRAEPALIGNSVTVLGQWMCPRSADVGVIRLAASRAPDLSGDQVRTSGLHHVDETVGCAAAHPGPLDRTVLLPR